MMGLSLSVVLATALGGAWVDDSSISAATLADIKSATVFIKIDSDQVTKSGSGFVIKSDDKATYIVTNEHVIATSVALGSGSARTITLKNPRITVVFGSGTKQEQSLPAEVLADDDDVDLAVLKVGPVPGIKPIAMSQVVELVETVPVYTFGFPYGSALSLAKKNPAITVGKAAVSSVRLNESGEVGLVQLDGSLNPGNSGGPVVDARGRLVGVAVATIRNSSGIGFAVPVLEVQRVLDGRSGETTLMPGKDSDSKSIVQVDLNVVDPFHHVKSVSIHYLPFESKYSSKVGSNESLDSISGTKKLKLAFDRRRARGEFAAPALGQPREFLVQATYDRDDGKTHLAKITRIKLGGRPVTETASAGPGSRGPSLAATRIVGGGNLDPVVKDKAPENGRLIGFKVRVNRTNRLRSLHSLQPIYDGPDGESTGQQIGAGAGVATTVKAREGYAVGAITGRAGARFDGFSITFMRVVSGGLDPKDSYESEWIGIERPGIGIKVGATGGSVVGIQARVRGTELSGLGLIVEQHARNAPSEEGPRPPAIEANKPPSKGNKEPAPATPNKSGHETEIVGGAFDPVFRDMAPPGGRLIGFEIGLGKFVNSELIHAIRPIYWTPKGEALGVQRGTDLSKMVTIKAKGGYAVGSVTARAGMNLDGMSVTFMRVQGDRLVTTDSYESEVVGHKGGREIKLGGTGSIVTGIVGKAGPKNSSGLGLVFGNPAIASTTEPPPPASTKPDYRAQANGNKAGSNATAILGGRTDPEFKDAAPSNGRLIGFEIGLGKFGKNDVIRAVRPIYWTPEGEVLGKQYGTDVSRVITVKAREGYAVGGLIAKAGWTMDGMLVTFMRLEGDHLLTSDSYDSDWIGGPGGGLRTTLGSTGSIVTGIIGKSNDKDCTGLGLWLSKSN